jgi:hypothetical protein
MDISYKNFCKIVKQKFSSQYMNRCPKPEELRRLHRINRGRGFPWLFASWDCKHFPWKLCPVGWQGQYHNGKEAGPSLLMEAIADADMFIWYHFFGEPGTLSDLNILDKSTIVESILSGEMDLNTDKYPINDVFRDGLYFLVDGIYPRWAIFMNKYKHPENEKERAFAVKQESVRKDVERSFGVLVQQWGIHPNQYYCARFHPCYSISVRI